MVRLFRFFWCLYLYLENVSDHLSKRNPFKCFWNPIAQINDWTWKMNSSIYHKIILLSYHSFNLRTLQTPMSIITRTIETRGSSMWASIARKRFTWKFQNRWHHRYLSKNVWVKKTCIHLDRSRPSIPPSFYIPSIHFLKVVDRGDDSRGPEKIVIPAVFQVFIGHITQPQNLSSTC